MKNRLKMLCCLVLSFVLSISAVLPAAAAQIAPPTDGIQAVPTIYKHLTNMSVPDGTVVNFVVMAYGTGTLSYQWQYMKPGETVWRNVTAESGKTFTPDGMNCPACGRPMTQQQIYTAELEFNERKAKALEDITVRGTAIKKRIEQRKSEMEVRAQKLASMQATLEEDRAKLAQLDKQLKTMTEEAPAVIVPEDIPGYMEKMAKIEATRLQMEAIEKEGANQDDKQAVLAAKQQATGQRDMLMKTLEAHNANTASEVRIKELEARGRELGQQIADIEKEVFTAERLEAARTDALEESVNTMFDTVKFRLFDTTLEGNRVETCVAVVGDALYPVANSAAKLNAGIDIIATLSTKLGCRCPIFIDNAEGVTSIEGRGLQIIELRVERGSKLEVTTIEY